ncbi:EspG family protein [Streptoalloteichus tenebrarius]|uniref:EspG family protein n=1 Tax=Streptoalloteichus tenebrarius (strain ATCC 17920 / DSM 40477 / JCM 4838 / CBS 697.72 / NBRC 16177 / NCIMB 11028 / NRRL B-12390 / A12253. 1 / ISP 5477) TaxID=1933 RepID=A0ABT1HR50_STRSD|nr:ESX secretion-associated protein EspG [Streptoalloteichus tenebrarius]MCP2257987.1 EspG family protein [Streptoalloteichus tenebrarius]BFF01654.1 ESX secretion-associated protein EspG [Streptoalloteichus tenebrarius]
MSTRITLSLLAVDALREHLDVKLPVLLEVPSHGDTLDERPGLLRRGWAEIQERGLGRPGELDPFVEDAFHLLARPPVGVHVIFGEHPDDERAAVVGMDGDKAVLAAILDGEFVLERLYAPSAARTLVGMLPDAPAGTGVSVTAATDALEDVVRRSAGSANAMAAGFASVGLRQEDAQHLARVLTAQRLRGGQFGAKSFDYVTGRTTRVPFTVDFIDTTDGRYLVQHKPAGDGRRWFTLAPGDRNRLTERVNELIRSASSTR